MYIYYDAKTDYLEVLERKCANYSEVLKAGIFEIRSERSDRVIGYGIENASKRLEKLDLFNPYQKLSIMVKMARLSRGLTQVQMAKKMKIGLLPYQRLESGSHNPTLKTLLRLKEVLPEVNLDEIAA